MATNLVRFDLGGTARWGVVSGSGVSPLAGDYPTTAALIEHGKADWRAAQKQAASLSLAACRTEVCGCSSDGFLRFAAAVAAQSGFVGVRLSLLDRRWSWIDGAPGRAPPSIGGGEGEQSLDVPGHGHEAPLAAGFFEPAQ